MVSFYKIVLVSILFLVSVSGVCAVDLDTNNADSLTTVEDNNLQLNNYTVLSASNVTSDNVNNLTDNDNIHRDKIGINITSNNLNISLMSDKINKSFNNLISINTILNHF